MKRPVLTNNDISSNFKDAEFHLMLSDFTSALAYWIISQESRLSVDVAKPLEGLSKRLRKEHFPEVDSIKKFTYSELESILSEEYFMEIPELKALNEMKPDFYDIWALARNVFFMVCRLEITQPL